MNPDLWSERINILNSVGVGMPARAEIAGFDVDPDRLRTAVRVAYGRGLRGSELVEATRSAVTAHDSTPAGSGSPGGEVDIATDDAEPNDPEMTKQNGGKETKEMRIAATTGTMPAVDGNTSLKPARRKAAKGKRPADRLMKAKDKSPPDADPPAVNGGLMKPPAAAEFLAIGKRKLWELTNSKRIPCVRIDRAVRYRLSDLERWIEEHRDGGLAG